MENEQYNHCDGKGFAFSFLVALIYLLLTTWAGL